MPSDPPYHSNGVLWSRVSPLPDRPTAIVATGPSLAQLNFNLLRHCNVIAINGAADFLTLPYLWFTLDPSPANRKISERIHKPYQGCMAVPEDYGQPNCRISTHRTALHNPDIRYLKRGLVGVFSSDPKVIGSGNSAYGGLNLAFLATRNNRNKKIAVFGVDGTQGYYCSPGTPRNLVGLDRLFETAVRPLENEGYQVLNGSPNSRVTCFLRAHPNKVAEWLTR